MARNALWSNPDGLSVGFGTHSSDNELFREVAKQGSRRIYQAYLIYASLVDTSTATSYPFDVHEAVVPRGSLALRGSVQSIVGAVGTNPTLDIGMWSRGLATEVVDTTDGLVADITEAELATIGEAHILDGSMIVAIGSSTAITVGATADMDCAIAPSYETDAFTAGTGLFTIEFQVPFGPAGATIAV